MSTLSEAGKLLKTSERESKINFRAIVLGLGGLLGLWFFGNMILSGNQPGIDLLKQREMPEATSLPVTPVATQFVIAPQEPTSTPTAWPTPIIIVQEKVIEVTREVSRYVEGAPIEVEVTREVQVFVTPLPTITPIPLAPGVVEICASVEGATGLYIGGQGVVSGECKLFTFAVGQTSIQVQINK